MMRRIFVDTSAWDAIADKGDKNHQVALQFRNVIDKRTKLITSNYVLDELYTLLLMNVGIRRAVDYKRKIDILIRENVLEVVWVNRNIAERAWMTFEHFNTDKQWSFTDCTSYVIMKAIGVQEVFAFDHHFEQMGFIRKP